MDAAWAQAKLERAQRSYNEMSRGMGFAARAYVPRRVKNLDSERSERRVSEANESKFSGAYIGMDPCIFSKCAETAIWFQLYGFRCFRIGEQKAVAFCEAVNCERSEQEGKFLFCAMMVPIIWFPMFSHWGTKSGGFL